MAPSASVTTTASFTGATPVPSMSRAWWIRRGVLLVSRAVTSVAVPVVASVMAGDLLLRYMEQANGVWNARENSGSQCSFRPRFRQGAQERATRRSAGFRRTGTGRARPRRRGRAADPPSGPVDARRRGPCRQPGDRRPAVAPDGDRRAGLGDGLPTADQRHDRGHRDRGGGRGTRRRRGRGADPRRGPGGGERQADGGRPRPGGLRTGSGPDRAGP